MWLPCPMVEHKINNEYDVILCALYLLLDCFEMQEQLFATQCIWWLASIIQFTEIFVYYRHYKIFPSDYINNLVVTPIPDQVPEEILVPESDTPLLDLAIDPDIVVRYSHEKLLLGHWINKQTKINTTRLGKVFKITKYSEPFIEQQQEKFRNQRKKQWRRTCEFLWSGECNIEGDYA